MAPTLATAAGASLFLVECRETIRGTCEKIAPKEKGEKEGEKK